MDKLGKDNVVVEFLSWIFNDGHAPLVEDMFPDEKLFVVYTNSSWFVDVSNYLVAGKIPSHLSPK
jgi:hypothetical protein